MLLHIGENVSIPLERLLFIVNRTGIMPRTQAFIDLAKREHRYMRAQGTPKSYLVVHERGREVVYESMLASSTLEKRLKEEIDMRYLKEQAVIIVEDA